MQTLRFADAIITHTNEIGHPINHTKLEKIVYYLNVIYMLEHNGHSLVTDPFEAWIFGPVNLDVYDEYAKYGRDPILKPDPHLSDITDNGLVFDHYEDHPVEAIVQQFIAVYYSHFYAFSDFDLVTLSQKEPQWKELRNNYQNHSRMLNGKSYQFYNHPKNQFWN